VAGGWVELLDVAADAGVSLPSGATRREQARLLEVLAQPATVADRLVFGPDQPTDTDADAFWQDVDRTRREMLAGLSSMQRARARLSLRSLAGRRRDAALASRRRRRAVPALSEPTQATVGGTA
jgi:hypothetical protein